MKIETFEFPVNLNVMRDLTSNDDVCISGEALDQFHDLLIDAFKKAVLKAMDEGGILPRRVELVGIFKVTGPKR